MTDRSLASGEGGNDRQRHRFQERFVEGQGPTVGENRAALGRFARGAQRDPDRSARRHIDLLAERAAAPDNLEDDVDQGRGGAEGENLRRTAFQPTAL
jgi:hypothetical protein